MKVLIISDIHGNLAALSAILAAEQSTDMIVCLGDLVDYGPQPAECIALVRKNDCIIVQGNHDYAVGCNADPLCSPAYKHLAKVTQDYTMSLLSETDLMFLAGIPVESQFEIEGRRVTAVHAAPSEPRFKYRPPDTPDPVWEAEVIMGWSPDILLLGHTHLPFMKVVDTTAIVNPGSVGQPKDGDPRAAYAVLENGEVALKRAEYDVELTIDALRNTNLMREDIDALSGILRRGGD